MRNLFAVALVVACSGCATKVPPLSEFTSARLCEIAVRGNFWVSESQAMGEIARRGENCNAHLPMINARVQADNANVSQSLELLRQSQPQFRPMPAPQSMRCVSQNVGGNIVTNCN